MLDVNSYFLALNYYLSLSFYVEWYLRTDRDGLNKPPSYNRIDLIRTFGFLVDILGAVVLFDPQALHLKRHVRRLSTTC